MTTGPEPALEPEQAGDEPLPPTRRRLTPADLICGVGLVSGIIASYVFIALTPKLLAHHAVLLEAFAGTNAAIVTGGALARVGRDSLLLVILAPLLTVALYDVFLWWAGRLWGNTIMAFYTRNSPRAARWIARAERMVRRRGVWVLVVAYYLPLPNYIVYVTCGISGMSLGAFVIGDVLGTLLWEALLISLGWAIGHHAVRIVDAIDHYSTWILIGLVVALIAVSLVRSHRQIRRMRSGNDAEDHSIGGSRRSRLG
jgi:membrane-associated protein